MTPDQPIGEWLQALASSAPAPGGGAAAALNAAVGAALIAMVCNVTIGRSRYARHEPVMREALAQATALRDRALHLAADDARAFGAVSQAYTLPRDTDEQTQARTERIQRALVRATEVPLDTAALAGDVIQVASRIVDGANVTALADVAAAALSARAALEASLITVETNLLAITDPARGQDLSGRTTSLSALVAEAESTVRRIRSRIHQNAEG
ncbi:MAG: cyclodeaminase/cyclohydrolase family protein [Candidatus Rokuibacteriota bacterium]